MADVRETIARAFWESIPGTGDTFTTEETPETLRFFNTAADKVIAAIPSIIADMLDVKILPMRLSGNRVEYWVRIICNGRSIDVRNYPGGSLNRALYELAELRHVLLGEPKPDLRDPMFADGPDDPQFLKALGMKEQGNV